jgi:hypothetical protein
MPEGTLPLLLCGEAELLFLALQLRFPLQV